AEVEDAADDDHREDADRSVEHGDRDGVVLRETESRRQDIDHRDLYEPEARWRQRNGRGQRRGDGHEDHLRRRKVETKSEENEQEPEDHEQVQEALRHDYPDRSRQRYSETALHQVAPVQIAELRRHQAVHEPAEEQDLEKVAPEDPRAALAEQARPADGADRER